jgi:Tol biopolymer transport system component
MIAFTGNRYLGWNVFRMDADGRNDIRLTSGPAHAAEWSPNGKQIAYVSQKADGKGDIWFMDTDGSHISA